MYNCKVLNNSEFTKSTMTSRSSDGSLFFPGIGKHCLPRRWSECKRSLFWSSLIHAHMSSESIKSLHMALLLEALQAWWHTVPGDPRPLSHTGQIMRAVVLASLKPFACHQCIHCTGICWLFFRFSTWRPACNIILVGAQRQSPVLELLLPVLQNARPSHQIPLGSPPARSPQMMQSKNSWIYIYIIIYI